MKLHQSLSVGSDPVVALEGVQKTYITETSSVRALDPVSFQFEKGAILSVVGPSGCGKSTLLRILAGIDAATGGRVIIDGKAISGPVPDMGIVFQRDLLLDGQCHASCGAGWAEQPGNA
jgi:NitT/TauT family transport system ATP-binding protein